MKTKIKERMENAVNAFFAGETLTKNNSLAFSDESGLLQKQMSETFIEKADVLVKLLKQAFLFFPGVFVLFNLSLILVIFALNPPIGTSLFYPERLTSILLVSAFMTMFGLGNIKNVKHLIIPASIILLASIAGAFVVLFGGGVKFIDSYAMYLLPLALIAPVLAKGWIDNKCEDFN